MLLEAREGIRLTEKETNILKFLFRLGFGRYTTQRELIDACHRIAAHAKAQEKLDA